VEALRDELNAIFLTPAFEHALWGVKIQSMETGQVLYELNPSKLMMPASNMKLVTMAAAVTRLGWDHRFETVLATNGVVENGVLHGDLFVRGGGDPTIGNDEDSPTATFDSWAHRLAAEGITAIDGRIIGDDDAFDDEPFGAAWEWTDIPFRSAAPISALQFNQGVVTLTIRPGERVGAPVTIDLTPDGSLLTIVNRATTSVPGERASIGLARLPTQPELVVSGSLPLDAEPSRRTAAVVNPTAFFVRAFRYALLREGIDVGGRAVDIDDLKHDREGSVLDPSTRREFIRFTSGTLAEVGTELMKVSQNLYAETLLKALGMELKGSGTADAGREVVAEVLASWGIPATGYMIFDGSGLSRRNYLTAETLLKILRAMYRAETFDQFLATLPIAGVDGTLERRMQATRAAGNVRAKTGTISNSRALSGFVTTRDGEVLGFSILANHFHLPGQTVLDQIDLAAERLANFSRER
jgi:D-alanyl-D-alanine carboxypeptidase/D-alanyl-D-alanine-endopeptidase (penicillin-binding protein 4)